MIVLDTDVLSELMRADTIVVGWLNQQPRTSVWTTSVTVLEIRRACDHAGRPSAISPVD